MTEAEIIDKLRSGGYSDAADYMLLILDAETTREAEFNYISRSIVLADYSEERERNQLRVLWTAYCIHYGLRRRRNMFEYTKDLAELWRKCWSIGCSQHWDGLADFARYMREYLV